MAFAYPPRLALAQTPTPLQLLQRLSQQIGGARIWIKRDDLTGSVLTGNKIRKLEFTLAQAQRDGCDAIVTCGGVQSNHCRATALLCAQLGLKCRLILRGDAQPPYDGNLLLDYLAGAEVSVFRPSVYQQNLADLLDDAAAQLRAAGFSPFVIPTGASDGIGAWGYIAACEELRADFVLNKIDPRYIVCATGSGGTQAGLTAGAALHALNAEVHGVAVCDDEAYFRNKVRSDLRDWQRRYAVALDIESLPIHVIDGYVGPGYAKATPDIFATIKRLASVEGIVLDPVYTGKAFHAMLTEIEKGRFRDCDDMVFIHTGGVFGLFPQRDQIDF